MNHPIFLDFEASSLNRNSYPIEVAWSNEDDSIESYLITPVAKWTDWDDYAEKEIHGISREQLSIDGVAVEWLIECMTNKLANKTIYVDGGEFDTVWCERLFDHNGYSGELPFQFRHVDELYVDEFGTWVKDNRAKVEVIQQEVRSNVGGQHRAGIDVRYLQGIYRAFKAECLK